MSLLDLLRRQTIAGRVEEEALYEAVVQELANGIKRDGLWAQAFAESDGRQDSTKARYLKLRVQALRDELTLARELVEARERRTAIEQAPELVSEVSQSTEFSHDEIEKSPIFEEARTTLRKKGFLVFRNSDSGWDVWSREAGTPKDHCSTLASFRDLALSK